ncbi:LmbE family N-acetylglucosaminyl deacetylase [Marmoricola sp. OAE513]|uniref:PIG-L deacetylase family protein n=1 Tax=Marmoricola sp. OAE513 TaxID=2817894 RepID=UPI001AE178A3
METLPHLPDAEFARVLCVVAHPDDVEYGTSAAVAKWVDQGVEVSYLLLTRGEAGMPLPPEETARIRRGEQEAACAAVGVSSLVMLEHPDGVLQPTLELRRDIARAIRTFRPDVVLTGSWEVEFVAGLNMADHRVAGMATLDAIRDADNPWVFPELVEEGLAPHRARWFLVSGHTQPTHGVDVTGDALAKGVASLEAHREYLGAIEGHPPAGFLIPMIASMGGKALGVEHAVLFRAYDFDAPPSFE